MVWYTLAVFDSALESFILYATGVTYETTNIGLDYGPPRPPHRDPLPWGGGEY